MQQYAPRTWPFPDRNTDTIKLTHYPPPHRNDCETIWHLVFAQGTPNCEPIYFEGCEELRVSWSRRFEEPIELPEGRKLRTLAEAMAWLAQESPKSEHKIYE